MTRHDPLALARWTFGATGGDIVVMLIVLAAPQLDGRAPRLQAQPSGGLAPHEDVHPGCTSLDGCRDSLLEETQATSQKAVERAVETQPLLQWDR